MIFVLRSWVFDLQSSNKHGVYGLLPALLLWGEEDLKEGIDDGMNWMNCVTILVMRSGLKFFSPQYARCLISNGKWQFFPYISLYGVVLKWVRQSLIRALGILKRQISFFRKVTTTRASLIGIIVRIGVFHRRIDIENYSLSSNSKDNEIDRKGLRVSIDSLAYNEYGIRFMLAPRSAKPLQEKVLLKFHGMRKLPGSLSFGGTLFWITAELSSLKKAGEICLILCHRICHQYWIGSRLYCNYFVRSNTNYRDLILGRGNRCKNKSYESFGALPSYEAKHRLRIHLELGKELANESGSKFIPILIVPSLCLFSPVFASPVSDMGNIIRVRSGSFNGSTSSELEASVVTAVKLPIRNPNEFDLWKMRIKQYFLMTDYSPWEVILNGDSPPPTRIVDGAIYEAEVKGSSPSSQNIQNISFVSSNNTDSLNESVTAAPSIFTASSKATVSTLPNVDSLSDAVIYSFFVSQSNNPQLDNEDLKQINPDDLEEMDLKWQMAMLTMRARSVMQSVAMIGVFRPMKNLLIKHLWHMPPQTHQVLQDQIMRENALTELRKKFKKAKQERNDLKLTLDKFQTLSKNLSKLLESQVNDKTDLGFDSQVFNSQVFDCEEFHSHESDNTVPKNLKNDRKCISPRDNWNKEAPRRTVLVEVSTSNALVSQYDAVGGYDWSFQVEEEPTNYALMTYASLGSSSSLGSDNKVAPCSKACSKTYAALQSHYNQVNFRESQYDVLSYKTVNDRYKSGKGYHPVLPPYIGTFVPPKPDLVFNDAPNASETVTNVTSDSEDGTEIEFVPKQIEPSFDPTTKHVKTPRKSVEVNKVNVVQGTKGNWVWKPKCTILDHVSILTSISMTLKQFDYTDAPGISNSVMAWVPKKILSFLFDVHGNPQQAPQDKGVIDIGCSRQMTGNISYLSDFQEFNEGYVTFGGNPKDGKISGKGKIKTGKLDIDDVYFVMELMFNLFSVSQMCDNKNSVLCTNTECVVLSSNYKLPDENHVFLRVPRENNMRNVDLKNSMNYQPVITGNQPNHNAGIKENLVVDADVAFVVQENEKDVHVFPCSIDKPKKHNDMDKRDDRGKSHVYLSTVVRDFKAEFEEFSINSTNRVNAVSAPASAVGQNPTNSTNNFNTACLSNTVGSPNFKIDGKSSFMDPSNYLDDPNMPALKDIVYSDDEEDVGEEADFSNLETNISVSPIPTTRVHKDYHIDVKHAFLYETIEEEVYVYQPLGFKDPDYPDKTKDDWIFINQDKYVAEILRKFGFIYVKSTSTPIEIEKPLLKHPNGEDVDVHIYRLLFPLHQLRLNMLLLLATVLRSWIFLMLMSFNDVVQLRVLIDRKKVVVIEDVIRPDLRLDDADGVECLPNENIFAKLAQQDKHTQALEILKLKKTVKKLEKKKKSRSSGGCIQTWEKIVEIDANEDISLVDVENQEEDDNAAEPIVFDDEEVTMTMAQTLIKMKAEKAKLLDEQITKRLHDEEVKQAATREKQEKDDLERAQVLR
nr:ribonuclease H-like domain-containing protein [Tanacetum cinerariifolium]